MCGICGIIDFSKPIEDGEQAVLRMNETLVHRGPDEDGALDLPHAAMAMRRLSIIDLKSGRQPIWNEDRTAAIVYNGETYNYRELRAELERKGHVFTTNSDTEAVLHAYEEFGEACLNRMNGMFAFAILDNKARRVFIARDRLGIKPLYYHFSNGRLFFASEIKALLAAPGVPRELDEVSMARYLAHLYVPGPRTIFKNILSLPPAHFISFDGGSCEPKRWWDLDFAPRDISFDEASEELGSMLADAVRMNLVSDVPLGVFLSGGVDSSAVTALMSLAAGGRVKTFSIGFHETSFDERRFARMVAERYSTDHEEFVVDYPDMADFLPRLARSFDQPFADAAAIPAFILAENAVRKVKVCLSGNGGDELFGGYTKYIAEKYMQLLGPVPAPVRRATLAVLEKFLPETPKLGDRNRRIKRILRYSLEAPDLRPVSWSTGFDIKGLRAVLGRDTAASLSHEHAFGPWLDSFARCSSPHMIARQMYTDISVYLPDNNLLKDDITGMANSLETRVPLLDHRVAECAVSVPPVFHVKGMRMKNLLKKSVEHLLPHEILERQKQGFTVPVGEWIKGRLSDYARESLTARQGSAFGAVLDAGEPLRLLAEHRAGRADHSMRLWALLVFQAWYSEFLG